MAPGGARPDLARAPREPGPVVQSGLRIQETLVAEPVARELRLNEGAQLEQQRLAVDRLAEELPRARLERLQPLRPAGRARRRDDDRRQEPEPAIAPELAADVEAMHVRHLGVQNDHIGTLGQGALQGLGAGERTEHREPVRLEGALQRSGGPLLVVRDQHEWRVTCTGSVGHATRVPGLADGGTPAAPRIRSQDSCDL